MTERARVPVHRDPRFRALVFQILALALVTYGFYSLFQTTVDNLVARGIQTKQASLMKWHRFKLASVRSSTTNSANQPTSMYFLSEYRTRYWSLYWTCRNDSRFLYRGNWLSPNWLVSRGALAYIEIFRNVPLLLQIMFWNFAIFLPSLPAPKIRSKWAPSI